jgi:hypothetical protein
MSRKSQPKTLDIFKPYLYPAYSTAANAAAS